MKGDDSSLPSLLPAQSSNSGVNIRNSGSERSLGGARRAQPRAGHPQEAEATRYESGVTGTCGGSTKEGSWMYEVLCSEDRSQFGGYPAS